MISGIFKNIFSKNSEPKHVDKTDIEKVIRQIREIESVQKIPLGKRIHSFSFGEYLLSLDRDITEYYRVTVHMGKERIYSFSIFTKQDNYEMLKEGYEKIINFLERDSKLNELPDNEKIKGYFYGY